MPLSRYGFEFLPSARRSILYAIRSGKEVDLYEGLDRILQHLSNIAESDDPETQAYYCAPQGHVTANGTVKLRDLDQLHDPDYRPSPHPPSGDEEREELAEEDLEHEAVVSSDEDEQEDQVDEERASIRENAGGLMEAARQYADHDDAESETSAFERSFATASSTEIPYKLSRLPDFRLSHAWLNPDNGEELVRYNAAVVEVKLCTEEVIRNGDISHHRLINRVIYGMAPQVIEAVQVAFAERPDQQEIVAIPTVNSFCCFVYFERGTVPSLDPAIANQGKGFQDPRGLTGWKLYKNYGKRLTDPLQIISGGGDFFDKKNVKASGELSGMGGKSLIFGKAFVSHWNHFVKWTRSRDRFPHPEDEED